MFQLMCALKHLVQKILSGGIVFTVLYFNAISMISKTDLTYYEDGGVVDAFIFANIPSNCCFINVQCLVSNLSIDKS